MTGVMTIYSRPLLNLFLHAAGRVVQNQAMRAARDGMRITMQTSAGTLSSILGAR